MEQKLLSLEWSREQIAAAFEIDGTITASNLNLNDAKKSFKAVYEFSGNENGIACLKVTTFARHIRFKIAPFERAQKRATKAQCLFVHCTKLGVVDYVEGDKVYALRAVKALTCLNIDTSELERFADLAITAHQKVEWLLEYDERIQL